MNINRKTTISEGDKPILPVALFEFSLGVWLIVKGFNPSAITSEPEPAKTATNELLSVA